MNDRPTTTTIFCPTCGRPELVPLRIRAVRLGAGSLTVEVTAAVVSHVCEER